VGEISEARIDESVRRILLAKARFGVLDAALIDLPVQVPVDESAALITEMFQAGVTVAQDNAELLPIAHDATIGVVFSGTRYGIRAACEGYHDQFVWRAVSGSPTSGDISSMQGLAGQVDVVVVFTQNVDANLTQADLVRALPPERTVVVALQSPFDLFAFPAISTYIMTYSPLEPAPDAACAALFGEIEPSLRSAVDLSAANTE